MGEVTAPNPWVASYSQIKIGSRIASLVACVVILKLLDLMHQVALQSATTARNVCLCFATSYLALFSPAVHPNNFRIQDSYFVNLKNGLACGLEQSSNFYF